MSHRRLLASLLAAAALPAVAQPALPEHPRRLVFPPGTWRPPTVAESRIDLAGGATAYVLSDDTLPLVDLVVVARAGAWADPPGLPGVAELTATMLRRGGVTALPPDGFDDRADDLGAVLSSRATMLWGVATLRCTRETLEESVALWLDMIERPAFDAGRLAVLRRSMEEGMSRRNLDPLQVLEREWSWLMYGAEHFSTRPLRPADLAALEAEHLRAFHRAHWRPENLLFAVAGAIGRDELRALVEPRLAAWQARAGPPPAAAPWPPAGPGPAAPPGLYVASADIPQAKILVGRRASAELPTPEERVRLEVMAELLAGQGAISRLGGRLRSVAGLVYRVSGRFDPGDLWPADHSVFFDTRAGDAARALTLALEEIARLGAAPPHRDELEVVRRELLARRRLEFDTAEEAVGYLVQDALVARDPEYRARYAELVAAVTAADVAATARRHFDPAQLTILVVGPWPEVAGPGGVDGWSALERAAGHRATHLPARDPLTLVP